SCVGTEVRGTKHRKRVEYFIYTMDNHCEVYEQYGYTLTEVQPASRRLWRPRCCDRPTQRTRRDDAEALDLEPFLENFSKEGLKSFSKNAKSNESDLK